MRATPLNHQAYFANDPGYELDHVVGLAGGGNTHCTYWRQFLRWNIYWQGRPYTDCRAGKLLALVLPRRERVACLGMLSRAELYTIELLDGSYGGLPPAQLYVLMEGIRQEAINARVLQLLGDKNNYGEFMACLGYTVPAPDEPLYMLRQLLGESQPAYLEIAASNNTQAAARWLGNYLGYPPDCTRRIQEIIYRFEVNI